MSASLFGNAQEANLRSCEQMVEAVLRKRAGEADRRIAGAKSPSWRLDHGSAQVFVFLTAEPSGENFLHVIAPVMHPTDEALAKPALFRRLLELNADELSGAAFALREGKVVVTTDRSTAGLDLVEVEEMIGRVADYADRYDDLLTAEFGGAHLRDL
jgi:hypothetical protein